MSTESHQFHQAALDGDLALLLSLYPSPAVNPNWQDDVFHRTPLFNACREGRLQVVKFLLGIEEVDVNLHNTNLASPFHVACQNGHVDIVQLLLADRRVDVNKPQKEGATPFCMACYNGHVEVVSILLEDDRIDVTTPEKDGATPFFVACQNVHLGVISLLLADDRIDVNRSRNTGASPLWFASQDGHLAVVQLLLASEREIEVQKRSPFNDKTAVEQARSVAKRTERFGNESEADFLMKKENCPKIADLIEEYERDPEKVRWELRRELRLHGLVAGELFALVIYLADGYLKISGEAEGNEENQPKASRFFALAAQLPMDLQMVLCNRVFGSGGSTIKRFHSEKGFRKFAKKF